MSIKCSSLLYRLLGHGHGREGTGLRLQSEYLEAPSVNSYQKSKISQKQRKQTNATCLPNSWFQIQAVPGLIPTNLRKQYFIQGCRMTTAQKNKRGLVLSWLVQKNYSQYYYGSVQPG